jgi:MFS family permease
MSGSPKTYETPLRGRGGEVATVAGTFLVYGAIFFDRLAPLYLVALIAADLGAPSAYEGTLALLIGLGWAAAMPLVKATSGRFGDRDRIIASAAVTAVFGLLSAAAGSWVLFIALRGIGGLAAASGAPATTALVFAAAPARRRGLDLGIVQSSTRIIGSLVAPVVVTAVAVAAGWRTAMVVSAVLLVAGALALLWAVPEDRRTRASRRGAVNEEFALLPGGRRNVLLCVAACVLLLAWLTVWSQSSVAVIQGWLGVNADVAGRLVGWFGVGSGIAALFLPILSDRVGRRAALGIGAAVGGAGGLGVGLFAALGTIPPRPVVTLSLLLSGVAMGGLPLVISIIPAEAVATGDVGRALTGPIAGGEILGAAVLPALAAVVAVPLGQAWVLALTAIGVLGLVGISAALRPLSLVEAS